MTFLRLEDSVMTGSSAFPTEYVDRTDAAYRTVPWYHFVLRPGKDGSSSQDFINSAEDLNSALEIKSLSESVPHVSAKGRELTVEFLRDEVSQIISRNDTEWVDECEGLLIIHHPNKHEKLVSVMSSLLVSPRSGGRRKMLSVHHADRLYSFEIDLYPNDHVAQDGLFFGLINSADPAVVRLVERDRGGTLRVNDLYATKQIMEEFAFYSFCLDLSYRLGISTGDMGGEYEPLGKSTYPDFEMSIAGQEWAVEVARVESRMTSYVEVSRRLDQKGLNRVFANYISDGRVGEVLSDEVDQKARIRAECSRYSRHCLLLVDIVDAVGPKGSSVWNGCDLSTFDVVTVVNMDGSVDYIKGREVLWEREIDG